MSGNWLENFRKETQTPGEIWTKLVFANKTFEQVVMTLFRKKSFYVWLYLPVDIFENMETGGIFFLLFFHSGWSSTTNKMIILRYQYHEVFLRLAAPAIMPAHLGAYSLKITSWYCDIIILLGVENHPNNYFFSPFL